MRKLKIGILCDDALPSTMVHALSAVSGFHLVGFSNNTGLNTSENGETEFLQDPQLLIEKSDAILLAMSPQHQFDWAKLTLKNSKHLFIEEPIITDVNKADTLLSMQREADVKVQVGCGLRMNESFLNWKGNKSRIQFLETQHLTQSDSDTPVVLDLMLSDIDFVLHLVKSEVRKISANGVRLNSNTPDMVNARLEFGNGCVASLTVNRQSPTEVHAAGIFENGASVFFDFTNKQNHAASRGAAATATKSHPRKMASIFTKELQAFYSSIVRDSVTMVSLAEACKALKIANEIMHKIEEGSID